MARKPADLSKVLAKKGEAEPAAPATDDAAQDKPRRRRDGRRLRKSERVQLNLKVVPDCREDVYDIADESGMTMGEVVERAVAMYKAEGDWRE